MFLKISPNSQENVRVSFLIKLQVWKSSSAAGRTGLRPVKAIVTLAFRLNFCVLQLKLKFIRNVKVTRALRGRRPVRPAVDDDFEITGLRPATLLKKDSFKHALLRALLDFQKHLSHRTPTNDCFCIIRMIPSETLPISFIFLWQSSEYLMWDQLVCVLRLGMESIYLEIFPVVVPHLNVTDLHRIILVMQMKKHW